MGMKNRDGELLGLKIAGFVREEIGIAGRNSNRKKKRMGGRYLIRLEFKIYTSIRDEHLYGQTPKSVPARYFRAFGNIIVLIRGYGIIEELLEMITWVRLGIHKKLTRYYNSLLALFDNGVQEGFIKSGAQEIIFSAPTAKKFIIKMGLKCRQGNIYLEFSSGVNIEYSNRDYDLALTTIVLLVYCSDVSDYEDEESNFCIYHNVHNISYHYTSQ
ncbi:hypothetical protein F8388_020767 [Cannabis sativa]|uniref:cytokinin riboside 5'-monophosphate phosphoribohydrolase n=1 Tax=Cannabis sativa TaxID=3483 RepID=A0A7J6EXN0_CANSA|nr:hypothetical protein F8388_020767 [Cannabis sativa]